MNEYLLTDNLMIKYHVYVPSKAYLEFKLCSVDSTSFNLIPLVNLRLITLKELILSYFRLKDDLFWELLNILFNSKSNYL